MSASTLSAPPAFKLDYGRDLEAEIARLQAAFTAAQLDPAPYPRRWLALRLLEGEAELAAEIQGRPGGAAVVQLAQALMGLMSGAAADAGLPLLVGTELVGTLELISFRAHVYKLSDLPLLTALAAPDWLHALMIDCLVAGVGGVLVFVPGLMVLFFFLSLLEDSGYLARAAFVMDRFMRVVGLHGKSFIPMILGFGCAVPAIYATRTLASRRDRILTSLLVPLMSCSARLPVYVVFGLAFFGSRAGTVIWLMYALGIGAP